MAPVVANRSMASKNSPSEGSDSTVAPGRASAMKNSVMALRPLNRSSPAVRSWKRIGSSTKALS